MALSSKQMIKPQRAPYKKPSKLKTGNIVKSSYFERLKPRLRSVIYVSVVLTPIVRMDEFIIDSSKEVENSSLKIAHTLLLVSKFHLIVCMYNSFSDCQRHLLDPFICLLFRLSKVREIYLFLKFNYFSAHFF